MRGPPTAPTAEGSLAKTPLPHLLVYAVDRRLTGTFVFTSGGTPLASMVVREGWLSKAAGASTEDELRVQAERLFALSKDTTFAYYSNADLLPGTSGPLKPVDPFPVMWRGIRHSPPREHIDATLERINGARLRPAQTAQFERFAFGELEAKAVERLNAQPSSLVELTDLLGPQVGQSFVYLLMILKQVELVDAAQTRPSASGPAAAPHTAGQAVARLPLQRIVTRPMVVEQQANRSHDKRASTPSLPNTQATAVAGVRKSVPPPALELPEEQRVRRSAILARAHEIRSEDYFAMLGVSQESSTTDIQKAFFALAKTWHPDKLPAALADVTEACSFVFTHLTEAHATLTDSERRAEYIELLQRGGATPDEQNLVHAVVEAATVFQKAEILFKRNPSDPQALELVKRCVELDPEQTDYTATLAWLEAQQPTCQGPERMMQKVAILDWCVEKAPGSERIRFYRAMLLKRAGQPERALEDFKRIAEQNPKNLDAVREVRLHHMRSSRAALPAVRPEGTGSGLFGKLFKKS